MGQAAEPEEIKVTDKRRINISWDDEPPTPHAETAAPVADVAEPVAPAHDYVAELEEQLAAAYDRARLAEERAVTAERLLTDVQGRFEQAQHKMRVEIDETRQRLNRMADEKVQRGKGEIIKSMLPVADNLAFALQAAERGGSLEVLLNGVRGTAQSFHNVLVSAGVEPLVAVGQQFNPEIHEAIDMIEVDEAQDGIVTAEYQRGYKMGERLLRPARVQVGRAS